MSKLIIGVAIIVCLGIVGVGVRLSRSQAEPLGNSGHYTVTVPSTPAPQQEGCPADTTNGPGIGPDPYSLPPFGTPSAHENNCMLNQAVQQASNQ